MSDSGNGTIPKSFTAPRYLECGKGIHSLATRAGKNSDKYIASSMINMYSSFGAMQEAQQVFDHLPGSSLVAWNSLIMGYAENDNPEAALELFSQNLCTPDERTFVAALKACSGMVPRGGDKEKSGEETRKREALEKGMWVHSLAAEQEFDRSITFVGNTLVDMYSKCGSMFDARVVFDRMMHRTVVAWNALLLGYSENDEENLALLLFSSMQQASEGFAPDDRSFIAVLKACTNLAEKEQGVELGGRVLKARSLELGRELHRGASELGFDSDKFVGSTLVDMYSKCGSMAEAQRAFDRVSVHDVVTWTALMLGYAENGEEQTSLRVFYQLQSQKLFMTNTLTFVAALKACIGLAEKEEFRELDGRLLKVESLQRGVEVHRQAVKNSCQDDMLVANTLVDLYGKCGCTIEARRVFHSMPARSPVSWNILLLGLVENGEAELALQWFSRMEKSWAPEARSFVAALKACTLLAGKEDGRFLEGKLVKLEALEKGMDLHRQAVRCGLERDVFVVSSLLDMYSRCGSLADARRAFDRMRHWDMVLWTSLMLGYVENDEAEITLELFSRMESGGFSPNSRSFTAAIKACSCMAGNENGEQIGERIIKLVSLEKGMSLHSLAIQASVDSELFVANAMVDLYGKCGSMGDSRRVFDKMPVWDSVSWTSLISGYAENFEGALGLELFLELALLEEEDVLPSSTRLFAAALKSCSSAVLLESGRRVHGEVCRRGLENDLLVINCLIDLYGKCGSVLDAQRVFDSIEHCSSLDVVAWNSLMTSYGRQGDVRRVRELLREMIDQGVEADGVSFICVLTTCSHAGLVDEGLNYFEAMNRIKPGRSGRRLAPRLEHYHCVIDMLGRSNRLQEAMEMIERMEYEATGLTWMTMLGACQKWKKVEIGRKVFDRLIGIQDRDVAAYSLMMNIYASAGMWNEQLQIEEMRVKAQARRKPR